MKRRQLLASSVTTLTVFGGNMAGARPATEMKRSLENERQTTPENGLLTVERDESFQSVVEGITTAIETNEHLTLVTTLDHAANAVRVGKELCPTTVIMFGNPALGTPLMQRERTVGIDLPQKLLVWDDDGVHVTYNDPRYLAERHGIADADETLTTIANALEKITKNAGRQ